MSTLVFAKVRSGKLSNRDLAKHYDRLYNQNKIKFGETGLEGNIKKAAYIRKNHPYIEVRVRQEKLQSLIDRAGLELHGDIEVITGGIQRNLTVLEEKLDKGLTQKIQPINHPAVALDSTKDLKEQVLNLSRISGEGGKIDFNTSMDLSLATDIDPDMMEPKNVSAETQTEIVDTREVGEQIGEQISKVFQAMGSQTDLTPSLSENYSEGEDNEEAETPSMEVDAPQRQVMAITNKMKLDTGNSIPVWKKANNSTDEAAYLRQYIRDLTRFKELGLLDNDAVLINASLVKSGRTAIYAEMPKEAETKVEEFIKYLRVAYGLSAVDLLRELQSTKQENHESPFAFLSRVINLYYEARNEPKKTAQQIMEVPTETNEIIRLYLNGLKDARVRVAIRSRLDDLDLTKIAKATRNAQMALKESNSLSVNHINADNGLSVDTITEELQVLNINSHRGKPFGQRNKFQRGRTNRQGSTRFENVECYFCHKRGHFARDCRQKTNSSWKSRGPSRKPGFSNRGTTRYGGPNSNYRSNKPTNPEAGQQKYSRRTPNFSCYECGKPGHYAKDCRSKRSQQ